MQKQLLKIAQSLEQKTITEIEARKLLLDLLILSEDTLATQGLTINHDDYGIWKLRQNGEYLMEGEQIVCHMRALEILQKHSK